MLIGEEIKEYQKIYKKVYGKDISYKKAEESGGKLVRFFQLLLDIDNRNKREDTEDAD